MSDSEFVVGVRLPNSGSYQPHTGVYYTRAYGLLEEQVNAAGGHSTRWSDDAGDAVMALS
jgi:hypothetical protein